MFNLKNGLTRRALLLVLPLAILTTSTGCVRMAQLLYVIKGHEVPADYDGLGESKIAVVCVTDASAYGPDTLTYSISKIVSMKLSQGLKDTKIISPPKVENWIDQNGPWENSEAVALGNDLGADKVLVIEIGSYSIHDGATLHKGSAELACTVYDIEKDGQVSYVHGPEEFSFPKNGRPSIQSTDRQFEAFFLARLTDRISRLFVMTDKTDDFASEAIMN